MHTVLEAVEKALNVISGGVRRVEMDVEENDTKVVAYRVSDNLIRLDITEGR